ncbi:MAG: protein-methionine-sulfoxide reductase heme-binding subunit MsrQ [Planktomarina sp.]|jgi:sulfoxide reductase heme-binding subunit YedZ|nr:protein-methionine-sulfoxide reductase heme-binding subunit MsrQ [Planktomarina sp.]
MFIQWINTGLRKIPTWVLYIILPIPGLLAIVAGLTDNLGPEPVNELEEQLGEFALKFLILGLAVSPLLHFTRINLVRFRRAIGLMAFAYVLAHFLVWFLLDLQALNQIWTEIAKRPYVTAGFAGFIVMIPLALTSNDWSVRRLRRFWRVLHRLTYLAAILAGLHFIMLSKGFDVEALAHMAVILAFLALRVSKWRHGLQSGLQGLRTKLIG